MKIVLDGMGSDNHPDPEVQGAVKAADELGVKITLVGRKETLQPRLDAVNLSDAPVDIVDAPEILDMTDKPAEAARRKAQNSMMVGLELVKSGEGAAFVTAGNTGGAMAAALFTLGRIRGVKRPAVTALFPIKGGHCVVLDIGANVDSKPEYLLQFALMGSIYAHKMLGVDRPRVGLLSNGEEPGKGNQLVKDTYPLLEASGLNFIGNVEGKEIYYGNAVDVVVTDGFVGNVFLKTSEAVAKLLFDLLRQELTASLRPKLGAALARPAFNNIKRLMDPAEIGAAPLLGVNGLVLIGHGRSDARAIYNAIRVARQAVEVDLLEALRQGITKGIHREDFAFRESV